MDVNFFQVESGTDPCHKTDMKEKPMPSDDEPAILERGSRAPVPPKRPELDSAPLSFAQRQIWLIDQMFPGNPAYNVPVGYRLKGALDASALEKGFNAIIRRHEGLRTTFSVKDGAPRQHIQPEYTLKIHFTALDSISPEESEKRLRALALEESVTPFDLSQLPLIRVSLFKLHDTEHILLINVHHIVIDGGSIRLMMDELDAFYQIFTGTNCGRPRDLTVQYPDYAQWQRDALAKQNDADQIAFWQKQLHGRLPVLELPGDLRRPSVQSFNGSNVFLDVPKALAQDLMALGARNGCTVFTTVLAAFQVLLYRYSGAEDFLIGTPVAVRARSELQPLIGNFLNMVALRCDLSGHPTFVQVLRRTRRMTLRAFGKVELPFERIVESLTLERDLSRNPIFQVMLEIMPAVTSHIGTLQVNPFYFDLGYAQFDLSLHFCEETDGYVCRFEYCRDLFKSDTIARLASNFGQLLHEIIRNPEQEISKIPILTEAEKRRVLEEWNSTSGDDAQDRGLHHLVEQTLHDLVSRQAKRSPHAIAAVFPSDRNGSSSHRELSYSELETRTNQLANYLRGVGVRSGDLVGLHVQRKEHLLIGLLGILKAGGAYIPLDPWFPKDRIRLMLEDSGTSLVLSEEGLVDSLPESNARVLCLDTHGETFAKESVEAPRLTVETGQLAYVIYTSGSTGRPKGVKVSHRAVLNFLSTMSRQPGFVSSDVLLAVTTLSFDIAVLELFLPLVVGGRVVVASREDTLEGNRLVALLEAFEITVMQATPATWRLLLEAGWAGRPALKILCGGEALPPEIASQLLDRCHSLWNMYGPTETTVWSAIKQITSAEDITIGRPIGNTQIYILDQALQPVPVGVVGELCIGGDGLAEGYLNRPDLTDEKFIPHPFKPGERLYRTGDLARYRADGEIVCLGRLDQQVKVRGFRIELGEIESAMIGHEKVHQAVAIVREDQPGDTRLVGYFCSVHGAEIESAELRDLLKQRLPDYMVPSNFVQLDLFPLTPNGKIDRQSLPAPGETGHHEVGTYVAPRDATELQLTKLWEKVLGRHPIGVKDDFFHLGGHSLLAAQLFARIENAMGVNLPLATLFHASTVAAFAELLHREDWSPSWASLVPIQPAGSKPPFYCIHGAEGNILLYRDLARHLGKDQPVYGLQAKGLDGREPLMTNFEDMAAHYIREIKTVQPDGPYHVGGYCLGGTLAYEIARQLRAGGDEVALLAFFETYNPNVWYASESLHIRIYHKIQNAGFHLRNLLMLDPKGRVKFIQQKASVEVSRAKLQLLSGFWSVIRSLSFGRFKGMQLPHVEVTKVNDQANQQYEAKPFDGRVTLFRPNGFFAGCKDLKFGWGHLVEVETYVLPVYPRGMLSEPFVKALAEKLGECLEHAAAKNE